MRGTYCILQEGGEKVVVCSLENVSGLINGGQHLVVVEEVSKLGFFVLWYLDSPRLYGFCQERKRIWFLCIKRRLLELAGISDEEALQLCEECLSSLRSGWGNISIDEILFCTKWTSTWCDPTIGPAR